MQLIAAVQISDNCLILELSLVKYALLTVLLQLQPNRPKSTLSQIQPVSDRVIK